MYKRFMILTLAVLSVAALAPGVAQAQRPRPVTINQQVARIATEGNSFTSAGIVSGGPGRRGAVTGRTTMSGNVFRTRFTVFYSRGTVRAESTLTATPRPDGGTTFSGRGSFTGGSGAYRGARGRFTVTGTLPRNSTVANLRLRGSIAY